MKVTLESTDKVVQVNNVAARIWEGQTATGIKVHAFLTRIACGEDEDQTQFKKELQETKKPSRELEAYPLRMLL